jgi:hypothetical protein
MLKRIAVAVVLLSIPALAAASRLEDTLESRWRGAWVVTTAETYSDCLGTYTNNHVNGSLVSGRARLRFKPGELGKLDKVDVKHSRIDLSITYTEPILAPQQDGPFTLYNETNCRVELQIELPRKMVSDDDVRGIEGAMVKVLARHEDETSARQDRAYNGRKREAYPADYDQTLKAHAVWKAQQVNAMVQNRIDTAVDLTTRLADRLESDPSYLSGFARGVKAARSVNLGGCREMLARTLGGSSSSGGVVNARQQGQDDPAGRGYKDGQDFVFGLGLIRGLPQCFVPVPEGS